MTWRDIWRGRTSSGRSVALQEDDDGDVRVVAARSGNPSGPPLEIEPDDGQSFMDALMTQGGFCAEEAASIESHVEDRS